MMELEHKSHMPVPKRCLFLFRKLEDITSMKTNCAAVGPL